MMQGALLSAVALLVIAVAWSFALLRRLRDWRAGLVIAWLAGSMLLLVLAIGGGFQSIVVGSVLGPGELQQLAIAGIALSAVIYFHVVFQRDALTGLPNRALLMHRLGRALGRVYRGRDRSCAVLFLDVDRFKVINDSLGHTTGDEMLVAVAKRLQTRVRHSDTLARLGGDEFVVVLQGVDQEGASCAAERLHQVLSRPIPVKGREVFVTVSIGIAVSARGVEGAETLLREADLAMYRAKIRGKARHEVFKHSMHVDALERLTLESDLRRAVERSDFMVYFQPIVSLLDGHLAGLEALVRWRHTERGLLLPDIFVPVAEETGIIVPLGLWVLEEACRQTAAWRRDYPAMDATVVHVNISGRQFGQADLVEQVTNILERTQLPARCLGLEMTETVMMDDTELAKDILTRLRSLGVQLQMDDFGTGYSSLSYLHRFPITSLKIDRSFVSEIETNEEHAKIVRLINTLARDLQLEVVAEGVETAEQLKLLREWGCQYAQGNYLCKAIDPRTIEDMIANRWPHWRRSSQPAGAAVAS